MIRTATATMKKTGEFVEVEINGETVVRVKDGNGFIRRVDRALADRGIARESWVPGSLGMEANVRIF